MLHEAEHCAKVAIDGVDKDLHVVFEEDVAGESDIFYTTSDDEGESWEDARNLSANPNGSADPSVAVDPEDDDDVHIVWTDSTDFIFALKYGQELPLEDGDQRRFANEDVIRFTGGVYEMVLDGSDVGLRNFRIDALAEVPLEELPVLGDVPLPQFVLSFTEAGNVPDLGWVDDSDLVLFTPDSLGEDTAGTFSFFLDGSDIGLTRSGEDVDAVEIDGGNLYLSTYGNLKLSGGLSGKDEDLFACEDYTPSDVSSCTNPTLVFDGSTRDMTSSAEDIDAFAFHFADPGETGNEPGGTAYFSTADDFALPTIAGDKSDLFSCVIPEEDPDADPPILADGTFTDDCGTPSAPFVITFVAETHGIDEDIMAIDFPNREVEEP